MKSYHSTSSISNINQDIQGVQDITGSSKSKAILSNIVTSPKRVKNEGNNQKSIEFTLPKISRLNAQLDQSEIDASKFSITLKKKKLDKDKKLRQSYGPIYRNLFNPHNKTLLKDISRVHEVYNTKNNESQGFLKELNEIKSPLSPRELRESGMMSPDIALTNNSELNNAVIESEKNQNIKAITNEEEKEELEKFFITNNNDSAIRMDDTLFKNKSKFADDTLLKTGNQNLSLFESQILQKAYDHKKLRQELDFISSDTLFYDTICILDQINSSLELMKAMNEKKSKRNDNILFQSVIQELLDRRLLIEDYVEKSKILELTNENKLYRGITISPETFKLVDELSKDEFNMIDKLGVDLDKQYYQNWKKFYGIKHSKLDQKEESKETKMFESVFDQYFKYKKMESKSTINEELLKEEESHNIKSFILYISIQEIARQVSLFNKDLGYMLLKVFKKYFEENEKVWLNLIGKCKNVIDILKTDRDILLKSHDLPQSLDSFLENNELTEENLMKHKQMIKELIGRVHEEEDKSVISELEKKHIDDEVRSWIYDWDRIRISHKLKQRIDQLEPSKLLQTHMMNDDHKSIQKSELALLINAERFITILDYRSKWEIEVDTIEERNKKLVLDNADLKSSVEYLREKCFNSEIIARSKEQENMSYSKIIKSLNSKLQNSHKESVAVQTVLDCRNVKFTEKADNLFKSKVQREHKPIVKLMRKVKLGSSKASPISLSETLNLISLIYSKKMQSLIEGEDILESFEEFVYTVLTKRFGIKNKIKQTCEKFLVALLQYKDDDSRIDTFAKFLGFSGDEKYHIEVLYFYLRIMKATEEPIGTLISGGTEQVHLETSRIIEKMLEIFRNASSTFKKEIRREVIIDSSILVDNRVLTDTGTSERLQLYILVKFYSNLTQQFSVPILQILLKFADEDGMLSLTKLKDLLFEYVPKSDLELVFVDDSTYIEFIKKFFGKHTIKIKDVDMLRVKSMAIFFRHKYQIKISAKKYLDDGLKFSLMFLFQARFQFQRLFEHYDTSGDGKIDFGEFKELVLEMDKNIPQWKIHALFQDATGSSDLEAGISFDEFVSAAMNNPLLDGIMELGYSRPINVKGTKEYKEKKEVAKEEDGNAQSEKESDSKDEEVGKFYDNSDEEKESFGLKYLRLKEGVGQNKKLKQDIGAGLRRGTIFKK